MPTTLAEFMEKVAEWNKEGERILNVANAEYAQDTSKFNNFHVTAMIMNQVCPELKGLVKPEHVIMVFQLKHLFSIWGGVSLRESMDGRYIDAGNYLHLHRGVREERLLQDDEPKDCDPDDDLTEDVVALLNSLYNAGALNDIDTELAGEFWDTRAKLLKETPEGTPGE